MFIAIATFLLLLSSVIYADLWDDLERVEVINREIDDRLPFFYNYSMVGGYFNMPSARIPREGDLATGYASVWPYTIYGANFTVFQRLELALNYRVFIDHLEARFGHKGFGDDAERIGNVKIGILTPEEGFSQWPVIAFGIDDAIGTKRFNAHYFVMTKEWLGANLELTLGWGKKRIKGFFGGGAWTPWRRSSRWIKGLTFVAEYDAINYKKHVHEHPKGRSFSTRLNAGLKFSFNEQLQLAISSLRGKEVAGGVSLNIPLGSTSGFFPKVQDPAPYRAPIDSEPLGLTRPEKEFGADLAYAFAAQGFELFDISLKYDPCIGKYLWLRLVNNRYRQESDLRDRIEDLLAALTPGDVNRVSVVVEAEGVESHAYTFRTSDLYSFRERCLGSQELEVLSPMREAPFFPSQYESANLFSRKRSAWTFTLHPRMITFFGSTSGKIKYSLGSMAACEGYLPGNCYYYVQGAYAFLSSMHGLTGSDRFNPSHLLQVRTDSMKYFKGKQAHLEEAYLQRSWNLGKGYFVRTAAGYFEPAYGGLALEGLLYPVKSPWAIGIEAAAVWKRHYHGFGFFSKINKLNHHNIEKKVPFTGLQALLNIYYNFEPLSVNLTLSAGQFLARDKGVRIEATRIFSNGLRFSAWLTLTNGHDRINGHRYFDKGFAFEIPFDLFLRQSSLTYLGYSMSAWLRDVGATARTGERLYPMLWEERH